MKSVTSFLSGLYGVRHIATWRWELDSNTPGPARPSRHGHPSTLHLWWARRPLTAARAVIFAQMVDDPSSWPGLFPTEKKREKERQRLFKIIEDLVQWENTTNETVLQRAREEIWQSSRAGLRRERRPSTTPSEAAGRFLWRRSGWGWKPAPAT